MCGICGVVSARLDWMPAREHLERMRDRLVHRGPDGSGIHVDSGVGLGHRRLAIVDLEHGQQPMYSDDNRFVIVYNGEIFNHSSIKTELESAGVRYKTRSDTETVIQLYVREGRESIQKLRGMFTIAIWDSTERRLFLARDRFGIKPLYYKHLTDGSLVFASEIKALLEWPGVRAELNFNALPDYLANHAPSGSETLFAGIKRLPAGHTLTWRNGQIQIEQYWDLNYLDDAVAPRVGSPRERDLVAEFTERFTEAVRLRLMSDVPLGMFLSGGIDSAAITATMAGLIDAPVQTFSVAFAEREANELAYARLVANQYRTEHREIVVSAREFFSELPNLVWHEDEPLAHPSSIALNFVSRLASQHVKVVLTGEGSDEMLAGYGRYRITEYNSRWGTTYQENIPASVRRVVRRAIQRLPAHSTLRQKAGRTFLARSADLDNLYLDNFAVFGREAQAEMLSPSVADAVAGIDPYEAYHHALDRVSGRSLLSQMLYGDAKTYLHELLMKQDQMSMAASIESRVPFLDHKFAEWMIALPPSMKLRGHTTKWILRAAMKGRLPAEILSRRKMGFPVPVGSWFRSEWRWLIDEFVNGTRLKARGIFDSTYIGRLAAEHNAGVNHSERLWALLNFEIWARIHLDGEDPAALRPDMTRSL